MQYLSQQCGIPEKPGSVYTLSSSSGAGGGWERDWPFVKVIDNKHLLEQLELGNSYHNHKEIHQDEIATLHVADVCRVDFFERGRV